MYFGAWLCETLSATRLLQASPLRFHTGWLSVSILCPLTHIYRLNDHIHYPKNIQNFLLLRLFAFFAHNLGVKRALSVY